MRLVTIKIMDYVKGTSTNVDGIPLFTKVSELIENGNKVRMSLEDLTPPSSSFLHATFGDLIAKFGIEKIRDSVVLTKYRKRDGERIKRYVTNIAQTV